MRGDGDTVPEETTTTVPEASPNGSARGHGKRGEQAGVATAPAPEAPRRCFVIAPIGREGSETRKRSDQVLRHIIDPVITSLGYSRGLRADKISESGRITRQIIQHIVEDELVIADLTESNPNVYYELALRHAIKKPFVQILAGDDPLPFDVADQRTIMVNHQDLDSVAAAKDELRRQVEALGDGSLEIDTPLTFALDVASLRGSDDPGDRTQGEMLEMLQELRSMTRSTYSAVRRRPINPADVTALRQYVETTSRAGDIVDEDVAKLVNPHTSTDHDNWVEEVQRRMNPFLAASRPVPAGSAPDPWATSAPDADEPPF
jgi:hypothetical protein